MTERQHERSSLERQARPETAYFERLAASTEQATKSVAPMVTSTARANLELMSLAGRRARAYMDIPNTLAQCRGPQDLFAAQGRFWQAAFQDYTDCTRRIATALSTLDPAASAGEEAGTERRQRDTLTFPDVFSFTPWALPDTPQRRRDAEDRAA